MRSECFDKLDALVRLFPELEEPVLACSEDEFVPFGDEHVSDCLFMHVRLFVSFRRWHVRQSHSRGYSSFSLLPLKRISLVNFIFNILLLLLIFTSMTLAKPGGKLCDFNHF